MRYLNPQVIGVTYTWTKDQNQATQFSPPHGILQSATYLHSPFAAIMCVEASCIRRRLDIPNTPIDSRTLQELKAKDITDYVAMPLNFSDASIHAMIGITDLRGSVKHVTPCRARSSLPSSTIISSVWSGRSVQAD